MKGEIGVKLKDLENCRKKTPLNSLKNKKIHIRKLAITLSIYVINSYCLFIIYIYRNYECSLVLLFNQKCDSFILKVNEITLWSTNNLNILLEQQKKESNSSIHGHFRHENIFDTRYEWNGVLLQHCLTNTPAWVCRCILYEFLKMQKLWSHSASPLQDNFSRCERHWECGFAWRILGFRGSVSRVIEQLCICLSRLKTANICMQCCIVRCASRLFESTWPGQSAVQIILPLHSLLEKREE